MAKSSDGEQVLLEQNISSCFMHFEGLKETDEPVWSYLEKDINIKFALNSHYHKGCKFHIDSTPFL